MDSKFSPGDVVKYKNSIFLVKSVLYMNPSVPTDPFVYGLVSTEKSNNYQQLLVRESLLSRLENDHNGASDADY